MLNDTQLDQKLKMGASQAQRFFEGRFDARRSEDAAIGRGRRQLFSSRALRRVCLAGAGLAAAAAVCAVIIFTAGGRGGTAAEAQPAEVIAEQTVCLSDDKEYRMNSVPVDMPDKSSGLITMLWEIHGGEKQMAYYSLFEACDTVYPALILVFPDPEYDMLLIASGNSAMGRLGYRLVGYSGGALSTWWAQDGVPSGLVTVSDGVAVETRGEGDDASVTYIVPVQTVQPGEVVLPVSALRMRVGERLLLVGAAGEDAARQSGLLCAEEQPETGGVSAVMLRALGAGSDVLRVGRKENAKTISIDIN